MTDIPQDNGETPVKPQVIDLAAEDVTDVGEKPEAKPAEPVKPLPPRKKQGMSRWIAAALLVGAVGGGWLYRDVLSSYLPASETLALRSRVDALEAATKTFKEQLLAVSNLADGMSGQTAGLDKSVKDLTGAVNGAQQKLGTLEQRLALAEKSLAAAASDLTNLRQAVASGGTGGAPVDSSALAALGQRIDSLEKDVASLKANTGGSGQSSAAALSQSLADIKAKIAAGTAYKDEFDRIARMVPAAPGLDVLAAHAELGLPNATGLAAELRSLIPSLPAPATSSPAENTSYWDSLWNGLTSIIKIRDIGVADWPGLAENAAKLAEAGDITQAVAMIDKAEGAKPSGISQWRDRAAARLKLETALEQTSQAVLRQITALGGAP